MAAKGNEFEPSMKYTVQVAPEDCTGCVVCVEACPAGAVEMGAQGPSFARPVDCSYCAMCEVTCPQGAIKCVFEIVWAAEEAS